MHTVVIGAGAVGGYFGGKLAKAGFPVTFFVRENRYQQLSKQGLNINSIHGDFAIQPTLATSTDEIDSPKLAIVALKNYHLEKALPELGELVRKGAKLLPLLNGIKHLDLLIEHFGEENVLGGLCYIESTLNEKGDIVHTSPMQDIVFGALSSVDLTFLNDVEAMLKDAEINVIQSNTILNEMWKKYIFLSALSGITSATRQPIGVALKDSITKKLLLDLVQELYTIGKARYSELDMDTVSEVVHKLENISPTMTSSMHRDLEKGQPIELESLHGYILQLANTLNISVPAVRAIYALLHPFVEGKMNEKERGA